MSRTFKKVKKPTQKNNLMRLPKCPHCLSYTKKLYYRIYTPTKYVSLPEVRYCPQCEQLFLGTRESALPEPSTPPQTQVNCSECQTTLLHTLNYRIYNPRPSRKTIQALRYCPHCLILFAWDNERYHKRWRMHKEVKTTLTPHKKK